VNLQMELYRAHSDTDQGTVMSTSKDLNVSKAGRKDTIRKSADEKTKIYAAKR
jgi:hypothetical protein